MIKSAAVIYGFVIAAIAVVNSAYAQGYSSYPSRPLRMIVAFAPGGATDILARTLAQHLNNALGQPVVVENRGGAGGMVGAEAAAKAAPDGYTTFLATISMVLAPSVYPKAPYDPIRDFTAITLLSSTPYILLVHPSVPVRSVKEFISLAKARPGQLNYASPGSGTPPHLGGELFKNVTGIEIVHIPYKGLAPALIDLLAGQVSIVFSSPVPALPHMKSSKVRALAVTATKRSMAAPEIPTLTEAGVPGVDVGSWSAMLAPVGTARTVVDRLHAELMRIIGVPEVRARLQAEGADPIGAGPDELNAYIQAEFIKWAMVVKRTGLRAE